MDPHPSPLPPTACCFLFLYLFGVCVCVCAIIYVLLRPFGLSFVFVFSFLSFPFLSFDLISGLLLQYCFTTSPRCFAIFLPLPTRSPHSVCSIPFFFFSILFLYSFLFCLFIFYSQLHLFSYFIFYCAFLFRAFLFSRCSLCIYYLKVKIFFFCFYIKYSRI